MATLSLAPDMDKLVETGEVAKTWTDTPTKGFVTNSVVVFVTRKGNPKNVKTWDDLLKEGRRGHHALHVTSAARAGT